MEQIAAFCRRWDIARLEVFGSALGDDFRSDSDLDLVATYAPQARWSLLGRVRMKLELEAMLGREVDLLNGRALEKAKRHAQDCIIGSVGHNDDEFRGGAHALPQLRMPAA